MNFKNKSILITGGTGSFGTRFVKRILDDTDCSRLVVFSIDELKQYQLLEQLKRSNKEDIDKNRLRFFFLSLNSTPILRDAPEQFLISALAGSTKKENNKIILFRFKVNKFFKELIAL